MDIYEQFRRDLECLSPEVSEWAREQAEVEDALKHAPCRGGEDCDCPTTLEHYWRLLRDIRES